jgi:hypothetical protein
MPWWDGTKTYENWKPLRLPYEAERHTLTVERFKLECVECGKSNERLRGKFVEYDNCVEILCGGICHDCRLITYGRIRVYDDDRVLHQARGGWHVIRMVPVHPVREFIERIADQIRRRFGHS